MAISSKITFNIISKKMIIVKRKLSISTFFGGVEKIFLKVGAGFYAL